MYEADSSGHWAIFWEVDSLERVAEGDRLTVDEFTGHGKKKPYGNAVSPEVPLLVEHLKFRSSSRSPPPSPSGGGTLGSPGACPNNMKNLSNMLPGAAPLQRGLLLTCTTARK
jgi:hypothetical protein